MVLDDLRRPLLAKMASISGLEAICVADREGVPVLQCAKDNSPVEAMLRPSYLSTYGISADHSNRMGMGKNRFLIASFENFQVVHVDHEPLVLTLIASADSNTGLLLDFSDSLKLLIKDMEKAVLKD